MQWSPIIPGLRVALRSDQLRISCAQVIRGQDVRQQQGGAQQQAPGRSLHRGSSRSSSGRRAASPPAHLSGKRTASAFELLQMQHVNGSAQS